MSFDLLLREAAKCGEPWRTLVSQLDGFFATGQIEIFHVEGPHPRNEQADLQALSVVGIVPGQLVPAGRLIVLDDTSKSPTEFVAALQAAAPYIRAGESWLCLPLPRLTGMLAATLGKDRVQFVGALSVCRTVRSHKQYTALWARSGLHDELVGAVVRLTLPDHL